MGAALNCTIPAVSVSLEAKLAPAKAGGTNWRIHAVYDLGSASFSHLELTDEKGPETLTYDTPVEGTIAIADRGYARANDMAAFLQPYGERTGDYIVRIGWNSLRLENVDGSPFDLIALLNAMTETPGCPDTPTPTEWTGRALYGRGTRIRKLPLRLAILPLPPDKVEIARKKIRRTASKQQTKLNPNTLLAAGFLMLATSLATEFPAADICVVYRLRWQTCPCEGEGRVGVQTAEVADPGGSVAHPDRRRGTKLDPSAPHSRTADRRHLPGNPGIFPLWTTLRPGSIRHSGASKSSSSIRSARLCSLDGFLSRLCSAWTRQHTLCSAIRNESGNGKWNSPGRA